MVASSAVPNVSRWSLRSALIALFAALVIGMSLALVSADGVGAEKDAGDTSIVLVAERTPTPEPTVEPELVIVDEIEVGEETDGEAPADVDIEAADEGIDPEPEPPAEEITLVVHTWFCALPVEEANPSLDYYFGNCADGMDDIGFNLVFDGGYLPNQTVDGLAVWSPLVPGSGTLQEVVPDGYGRPIVFCNADVPTGEWARMEVQGETIGIELAIPGSTFDCHWFNWFSNTVVAVKYDCPPGLHDPQEDLAYFAATCTDTSYAVQFTLDGPAGAYDDVTGPDGFATFPPQQPGTYTLNEEVPAGFGEPAVFCKMAEWDIAGDIVRLDALDATVSFDLPLTHTHETCSWFNIPEEGDGAIEIAKYTCPAGQPQTDDIDDYEGSCDVATNGVLFTAQRQPGGLVLEQITGDSGVNGHAEFVDLASGTYHVAEEMPFGTVRVDVFCVSQGEVAPHESVAPDTISLALAPGQQIHCYWYNVPAEDGELDGALQVVKYWCESEVYTVAACETGVGGAAFMLSRADGEGAPLFYETGDDGFYQTALQAPGLVTLEEVGQQWCHVESPDFDAEGNIVLSDWHVSEVRVFNCAEDADELNENDGDDDGGDGDGVEEDGGGDDDLGLIQLPNTGAGPGARSDDVPCSSGRR